MSSTYSIILTEDQSGKWRSVVAYYGEAGSDTNVGHRANTEHATPTGAILSAENAILNHRLERMAAAQLVKHKEAA